MSDPNYSLINWREYCQEKWGQEWNVPEPVYRFSGGNRDILSPANRVFRSTDNSTHGVYRRG